MNALSYQTSRRLPAVVGMMVIVALIASSLLPPAAGATSMVTVLVKDAAGAAVAGATVCIGTSLDRAQFGTTSTDQWGKATFAGLSLDTPFYMTASKDGYGVEHYVSNASPVPIENLFVTLELPATPSSTACPGDSGSSLDFGLAIEIDPATLMAGELFEILIMLDRPPPVPVPVTLDSSRPDLIQLPQEVTFSKGEQKKVVKARVASRVSQAASVDVRAGIGKDPKKKTQKTVRVSPKSRR